MGSIANGHARLVGISGPLLGQKLQLSDTEVSIGRESTNALWAQDQALSRKHCVIVCEEDIWQIRDLNSHNGTLINGVRIEIHELRHRDQISVGDSILVFLEHEGADHPENAPVELTDTAELDRVPVRLAQEDAIYLQPERVLAELPKDDRRARDLNTLLKIATGVGQIHDRDALEWQILGMVFDVVPADRAAILHFAPGAENFDSAFAWDRTLGPGNKVPVSRTVVRQVLRERAGLMVADVTDDEGLREVKTLAQLQVCSLLCVPLITNQVVTAVLYLDSRSPRRKFDREHLELITAMASIASLALEGGKSPSAVGDQP